MTRADAVTHSSQLCSLRGACGFLLLSAGREASGRLGTGTLGGRVKCGASVTPVQGEPSAGRGQGTSSRASLSSARSGCPAEGRWTGEDQAGISPTGEVGGPTSHSSMTWPAVVSSLQSDQSCLAPHQHQVPCGGCRDVGDSEFCPWALVPGHLSL